MKFIIVNKEGKYWCKTDYWTFDIRQAYNFGGPAHTAILMPDQEYAALWDGDRLWKLVEMQRQRTCRCGVIYMADLQYRMALNSPNSPICPDCEDKRTDHMAAMNGETV